jgi:hypothetical protein
MPETKTMPSIAAKTQRILTKLSRSFKIKGETKITITGAK